MSDEIEVQSGEGSAATPAPAAESQSDRDAEAAAAEAAALAAAQAAALKPAAPSGARSRSRVVSPPPPPPPAVKLTVQMPGGPAVVRITNHTPMTMIEPETGAVITAGTVTTVRCASGEQVQRLQAAIKALADRNKYDIRKLIVTVHPA